MQVVPVLAVLGFVVVDCHLRISQGGSARGHNFWEGVALLGAAAAVIHRDHVVNISLHGILIVTNMGHHDCASITREDLLVR